MKRRRWDSNTKTKIVLECLSGRPVSEICNELDKGVESYNRSYLHSALGYRTPLQVEAEYYKKSKDSLLNAA